MENRRREGSRAIRLKIKVVGRSYPRHFPRQGIGRNLKFAIRGWGGLGDTEYSPATSLLLVAAMLAKCWIRGPNV